MKILVLAIWLVILGLCGYAALQYWGHDQTAAWTNIILILVATAAAWFFWRKVG